MPVPAARHNGRDDDDDDRGEMPPQQQPPRPRNRRVLTTDPSHNANSVTIDGADATMSQRGQQQQRDRTRDSGDDQRGGARGGGGGGGGGGGENSILFDQSKDELFSLTNGYKKFQRELKNWKLVTNRDDITLEKWAFLSILYVICMFFR